MVVAEVAATAMAAEAAVTTMGTVAGETADTVGGATTGGKTERFQ